MLNDNSSNKESDNSSKSSSWLSNKEKEIVSGFISTLLEEEKKEQEKNFVIDFIGTLFEEEKSIIIKKNGNIIPLKKKCLNNHLISSKIQNKRNVNNENTIKRNYTNIKNFFIMKMQEEEKIIYNFKLSIILK